MAKKANRNSCPKTSKKYSSITENNREKKASMCAYKLQFSINNINPEKQKSGTDAATSKKKLFSEI
jgi:hypothetical protein